MYEKKHWDGDLADLTGQCVKVGHEMFDLFERSTTPIRTLEHYCDQLQLTGNCERTNQNVAFSIHRALMQSSWMEIQGRWG
jgi:hypothetical protein